MVGCEWDIVHPNFVWLIRIFVRLAVLMQSHSHKFGKHQQRIQWQGVFAIVETKQKLDGAHNFATTLLIALSGLILVPRPPALQRKQGSSSSMP